MTTIQYTTDAFSLDGVSLSEPVGVKNYNFSELSLNEEPIYVQLCNTGISNGICVNDNGDSYVKLLIDENNEETLEWFEKFDEKMRDLLVVNGEEWFENEITPEDMEVAYNSSVSIQDDSDDAFIFKVYLPKNYNKRSNLNIYDEDEELLRSSILNEDDLELTPLIEVKGIKFDSSSFHLYAVLRQAMVMNNDGEEDSEDGGDNSEDENDVDDGEKDVDDSEDGEDGEDGKDGEDGEDDSEDENDGEDGEDGEKEVDDSDNGDESDDEEKDDKDDKDGDDVKDVKDDKDGDVLEEVTLELNETDNADQLVLKKPNEVYINMWKEARAKAKQAKNDAIKAYLEAKNIKSTWLLDEEEGDDLKDIELLLKNESSTTDVSEPVALDL